MRKFTLEQYIKMSESFNKMNFTDKIKTIKDNSDILTLASDYNWWAVKLKDKEMQIELTEEDIEFEIENEWCYDEMNSLISLLGISNTDL